MSASHRWLCVAYAFPPINRSGTHRTVGFVKHLAEMGWDATVLTVEPSGEPVDDALLTQVPPPTRVTRTPCIDHVATLKRWFGEKVEESKSRKVETEGGDQVTNDHNKSLSDWFSRLLQLPDSRRGWIGPAVRAGFEAICDDAPDVLYSTSPCMSAHLVARTLKRHTGLPWVADFRDPWRDNPFRALGYRSLDWLDARMERGVLRDADRIILNTPTARDALLARYPDLAAKCRVILNGYDPETFEGIVPMRDAGVHEYVIAHAGQFYGHRSPLPLLRGLRAALDCRPSLRERLRLELIGAADFEGTALTALAAREGVGDAMRVVGPLPHRAALGRLRGADALLLAGSTGPGSNLQIPAKAFEYVALRRPVIALLADGHPARELLETARVPHLSTSPEDAAGIAHALTAAASEGFACGQDAWSGAWPLARRHRAEELRVVFETLLAPGQAVAGHAARLWSVPGRAALSLR